MNTQHSATAPVAGAGLTVAALGVVFGDIGTSPLYAFRESLAGEHDLAVIEPNVLGVLSLMFWSLIIVITIKYLLIVMRADNDGEGGILALASLVSPRTKVRAVLIVLGLFGTALLYGDGMITPAISVLSAVEGIEVAAPSVHDFVVPIVAVILAGLFLIQKHGTSTVGRAFGPVMLVWFATLGILGISHVGDAPRVLRALNPIHAVDFFVEHGGSGVLVLGSVFLVVTGGEALYADMGHFGRSPIQRGWFFIVLPGLFLNYLGQGALLISDPTAIENPFFLMAPSWTQWPLTILATLATIIASQALITGAFSLTQQAINMGYLPRMRVVETSAEHRGQVYVPAVNWFLLVSCLALVFVFGSSTKLAAAYGVAVTLTMIITTMLVAVVALDRWDWSPARTVLVLAPLGMVDLAFLGGNIFKIPSGGWFPLAVGLAGFVVFTTWRTGRQLLTDQVQQKKLTAERFIANLAADPPQRHEGTAVYLHRAPGQVPPALLTNLRHNETLHETVAFVSITTASEPRVLRARRCTVEEFELGFVEIDIRYGFAETPRLDHDLRHILGHRVPLRKEETTYFVSRESIEVTDRPGMAPWRERLFAFMARNASDPTVSFGIPTERTVEIGSHVEI